jgi:hypothetical protein
MSINYAYNFAEIDDLTHMCVGVVTGTTPDGFGHTAGGTTYVSIPVYDEEYIMKYYFCSAHTEVVPECTDGNWFSDAAGTIPWQSSLL